MRKAMLAVMLLALSGCKSHPNINLSAARPSMPIGVVTSASDAAVTVSWAPNDSEELVTSYSVSSAATDWTTWSEALPGAAQATNLACCSFTRTGLQNERDYWFAVSARNGVGAGPSSVPARSRPPGWQGNETFGTAMTDVATAAAIDPDGDLFVVGYTLGSIGIEGSAGGQDGIILKLDPRGRLVAAHQWGTSGDDGFYAVTISPDGVFVAGVRNGQTDAVLLRFDFEGIFQQATTVVHSGSAVGLAADSDGKIYVSGYTLDNEASIDSIHWTTNVNGQTPGYCGDAILARYDSNLNLLWGRELGSNVGATLCSGNPSTAIDVATSISVNATSVSMAGYTTGILAGQTSLGGTDAFIASYSVLDGTPLWTPVARQIGTTSEDEFLALATDASGNLYAAGYSLGSMPSLSSSGGSDVIAVSLDASGSLQWTQQFGGAGLDRAQAVTVDQRLFLAGYTTSSPLGPALNSDSFDASLDPLTGGIEWVGQSLDPGNDALFGMALTNGCTIGVGERTAPRGTTTDLFVIKFDGAGLVE